MKKITFFKSKMLFKLIAFFGFFLCTGLLSESHAQIAYTQNFATTSHGWTTTQFTRSTVNVCATTGSLRRKLNFSAPTGITKSPTIGASNGGEVTLSYQYKVINSSGGGATSNNFGSFKVQYSTDNATWFDVPESTISTNHVPSTTCATKTLNFSIVPSTETYIRFNATWSSGDYYLYFDEVAISQGAAPSCASPSGFVASGITSEAATIAWNATATAPSTGYEYYFSSVNTAPSGAGTPTTGLSAALTSLTPNTTYYVWLRSDCGSEQSYWNGPFSFTTTCNPYTIPYFEGFETGYTHNATVGGCITQASESGAGVWTANSTFTDYNRTPRTGNFNAFLAWDNLDWMFIPIQLEGGTSYRVSLYARQDGATAANSNMAISYGVANNAAAMTNSIVAATGIINGNYQEIFGDFTPTTSGIYYVGIRGFMNGNPWYISLDDISVTLSPTCFNPTGIVASNITANSVDLFWTDPTGGSQLDYEYVIQAPGTGIPAGSGSPTGDVSVIDAEFDVNGNPLLPNTPYEVYVRADCNGGDFSTWSGPINFRTLCLPVSTLNENFDTVTTPALPDCWSKILRGPSLSTYASIETFDEPTNSAPNSVFLYNEDSVTTTINNDIILVTPFLSNLGAGTHRLKFYASMQGSIQVGTLNNNSSTAVFTPFQTIITTDTPTLYEVDFSTYSGTDTFIGFRHNAGTFVSMYIDDVVWEPIPTTAPSCASNIVASPNPSCGNFANSITWDSTPNADGYYVTVGTTSGANDIANASSIATNTYSFSGNFGTTYYYKIVPFNNFGSATGCTEQSFTTNASGCYCVSAPTSVDGTGITNVQLVATNFANTVSTTPVYNDHTATVVDMSQGINNNVQITFNTNSFGTSYDYNTVIWIDVNDNFTFEPSEIVFTGVSAAVSPTILNASFVMSGTAPLGQHRMRIVATDALQTPANPCYSGTWGETADFTVNVVAAPSCLPPTTLNATNITTTSANIGWTSGGTVTSWDIEWGTFGFAPTGTPTINGATNPQSVTTLSPNTTYSYYVRSNCGTNSVSNWSGPFSFTTTCSADAIPYSQNFESTTSTNLPSCTVQQNVGTGNLWTVQNNPGYGFTTKTLSYAYHPNNNANVWFFTNGVNLVAGTNYKISYDYGSASSFNVEKLKVSYGTTATAAGMTTLLADHSNVVNNVTPINNFVNFTPTTSGVYYFGFHAYSVANQFNLYVDNILVDLALSSGSFDNNSFVAYPNPVKDVLNVSYTSEISSVKIINMLGQEVISKNINATSSQIDMSQLSAGTYIVNVKVGDTIKTLKVVKQ